MIGHGWNKFHEDDTFIVDTFSLARADGVAQLIYGTQQTIELELRNLENFKQALSLFSHDRVDKIKAKEERFTYLKKAKKEKSKKELASIMETLEPLKEIDSIDTSDFKLDNETFYQRRAVDQTKRYNRPESTPQRAEKEKQMLEILEDWEDRRTGAKKSKTLPLNMDCFAMQFEVQSMTEFNMKVRKSKVPAVDFLDDLFNGPRY